MNHLLRNGIRGFGAFAGVTVVLAIVGCNSDSKQPVDTGDHLNFCDLPKPCQDIAQACHPKDDGTPGKIHDCHETGHDVGTLAACMPVLQDCLTTCAAAPAFDDGPVEDLGANCKKDAGP